MRNIPIKQFIKYIFKESRVIYMSRNSTATDQFYVCNHISSIVYATRRTRYMTQSMRYKHT